MTSIAPTIGRKIYYVPTLEDVALGMTRQGTTEHVDATVVYVDAEAGTVNLRITDHVGATFVRHGIAVADEPQPGQAHWMGYQLSQAGVKPEPLTSGAWGVMSAAVESLTGGAEASAIQRALAVPVAEDGTVKVADIQAAVRGDVARFVDVNEYQGKAPEGAGVGTLYGGSLAAEQGYQPGIEAVQQAAGEAPATDSATNAGSQLSADKPLVAGNVVGD